MFATLSVRSTVAQAEEVTPAAPDEETVALRPSLAVDFWQGQFCVETLSVSCILQQLFQFV